MKLRELTNDCRLDRRILTALITSERFLREVRELWSGERIEAPWARLVAAWAVDFWDQYRRPIGREIQDRYGRAVREREAAPPVLAAAEEFLAGLSAEYDAAPEATNVDFLLDETERWWRRRELKRLADQVGEEADIGDPAAAEAMLAEYMPVRRSSPLGFSVWECPERAVAALERQAEALFTFPGALGQLLNPYLVRDSLIGVMGPEKRGKTFWLCEFAFRACLARLNVALFEMGDMSESQILRRLYSRAARVPSEARWCGESVEAAADCYENQSAKCDRPERASRCAEPVRLEGGAALDPDLIPADYRPCTRCRHCRPAVLYRQRVLRHHLSPADIHRAAVAVARRMGNRRLMGSVHPSGSVSVRGIHDILTAWKTREGYVPDVIVIDYADILAPERGSEDTREREDARWSALRRLSQEWHSLVLVATQSNTDSYGRKTLTRKHFSQDKRKLAHCVGMIGLNQTEAEQDSQLIRLNWVLHRETELTPYRQVTAVQDLRRGCPAVGSFWTPAGEGKAPETDAGDVDNE